MGKDAHKRFRTTPSFAACLVLLGALSLGAGGCGPPATPTRGFGSHRLLAARDPGLALRSFNGEATGIYLARALPGSMNNFSTYNRSLLDFATNEEKPIQEAVTSASILPGGVPGAGWSLVLLHFPSIAAIPTSGIGGASAQILSFIDETTGQRLDLTGVTNVSLGATRADPITVGRFDTGGAFGTWFGPPENLVALPRSISSFAGFDAQGGIGLMSTIDDMGNTTQSIVHLPFDGSAPTEIVAADLADHGFVTARAATPLAPGPAPLIQILGYSCPRVPDGAPPPRCFLLYSRGSLDGTQRHYFVRLLDDPREIELPGDNPFSSAISPDGHAVVWWAGSPNVTMFSWAVGADHAGTCGAAAEGPVLWRAPDDGFATLFISSGTNPSDSFSILITGTPGDACAVIASSQTRVASLVFSPDGSLLGRLEQDPTGGSTIHVSALDGSGDRTVAVGTDFQAIAFLDQRRLELRRANGDGLGLSWLDLETDPVVEHPMAERVQLATASSWVWLNPRWLLLGDSYSAADDTFTLSVVDAETGVERIVSTAVTEFRVPWTTVPPDVSDLPVAYIVRGRAASAQDGVWLARLPLTDFPP